MAHKPDTRAFDWVDVDDLERGDEVGALVCGLSIECSLSHGTNLSLKAVPVVRSLGLERYEKGAKTWMKEMHFQRRTE
jgi:hypothetical protein